MRERSSERIDVVAIVHEAMRAGLLAALIAVALATASPVRADVSTAVSGSTLIVTGDDSPDRIEIESTSMGLGSG